MLLISEINIIKKVICEIRNLTTPWVSVMTEYKTILKLVGKKWKFLVLIDILKLLVNVINFCLKINHLNHLSYIYK